MPDVVVDLPSEVRLGEWWEWGTYESVKDAVEALREAGIPVSDDGWLKVVTILPCLYCGSYEHATDECDLEGE